MGERRERLKSKDNSGMTTKLPNNISFLTA